MSRVKRGVAAHKRKKNLFRKTKGFLLGRKSQVKRAKEASLKAGFYAYRDRRVRKRDFRKLWNIRINAAAREHGLTYSKLINLLKKNKIELDRKMLAELAVNNPDVFKEIAKKVQK